MSLRQTFGRSPVLSAALAAALLLSGCASIVEDVSKHLLANDLKTIEHDHCVYEHDLALFRGCLKTRGGACEGDSTTALPHSVQHAAGQPVTPVQSGSSTTLSDSIANLPPSHPARTAYQVMSHPLTRQAADLHNHLRGHDTPAASSDDAGAQDSAGMGAQCGARPTHTMDLKLGHVKAFHEGLLASIGHSGWEALTDHCSQLLAKHKDAPDLPSLQADCRRAAFIHDYFKAYLRQGEFVGVDLSLNDEIQALDHKATAIKTGLAGIQAQIAPIQALMPASPSTALSSADAVTVANQTLTLVANIDAQARRGYQELVADDFLQLERDSREAGALANSLLRRNAAATAARLNQVLSALDSDLANLEARVGSSTDPTSATGKLAADLNAEAGKINTKLSNVVKVQSAGFISRDLTFGARLPSLELEVDPDRGRFKTDLVDVDAGNKRLTGKTDFSHLGVVTRESSGVGTGASIGAELVRIFFEAIFDAHEGLPALSQSGTQATGLTLGSDYSLPLYQDPTGHVSAADLTRIADINTGVALQTRLVIGRVISGIGPFSLNNPPLEDLLTEIITTSVRKATEKATWCWYACNLNEDVKTLEKDAATAAGDAVKKAAKDEEGKVEDWAHKKAEHAKVRLKISP